MTVLEHASGQTGGLAGGTTEEATGESTGESTDRWTYVIYAIVLVVFALQVYYQANGISRHMLALADQHKNLQFLLYPSLIWMGMGLLLLVFRTCVWMLYRPFPSIDRVAAPPLTVIIPAYNEGAMVQHSIESVVAEQSFASVFTRLPMDLTLPTGVGHTDPLQVAKTCLCEDGNRRFSDIAVAGQRLRDFLCCPIPPK